MHPQLRARSSVGSEHLVYTQGVRGSNPFAPTDKSKSLARSARFFLCPKTPSLLEGFWAKKSHFICAAKEDFCYFKMGCPGIFNPTTQARLRVFWHKKSRLIREANQDFCYFKMCRLGIFNPFTVHRLSSIVHRSTYIRDIQLLTSNF